MKILKKASRFFISTPEKALSNFLWLVACHSIVVGVLLALHPPEVIKLLGFSDIHERFFPSQGGVFHGVMAIAYIYGAIDIHKNKNMIIYAIIVKMAATGFLFFYYYFIESHWIIFLSGAVDFLMGAAIWGLLGYESRWSKAQAGKGQAQHHEQ